MYNTVVVFSLRIEQSWAVILLFDILKKILCFKLKIKRVIEELCSQFYCEHLTTMGLVDLCKNNFS